MDARGVLDHEVATQGGPRPGFDKPAALGFDHFLLKREISEVALQTVKRHQGEQHDGRHEPQDSPFGVE